MQHSRICFLSTWRYNLSNGKEEMWKQYLEKCKLYTASVETSALFMMKTGLFNHHRVKLKKYREKAVVPCVYFQMLNKVCGPV